MKETVKERENVEGFELCELSGKGAMWALLAIYSPGHIYGRCRTLLPRSQNDPEALE